MLAEAEPQHPGTKQGVARQIELALNRHYRRDAAHRGPPKGAAIQGLIGIVQGPASFWFALGIAGAAWFISRASERPIARAVRAVAKPWLLGLAAVAILYAFARTFASRLGTEYARSIEDAALWIKQALSGWTEIGFAGFAALVFLLFVSTLLAPRLRALSRGLAVFGLLNSIFAILTAATTFTLFADNRLGVVIEQLEEQRKAHQAEAERAAANDLNIGRRRAAQNAAELLAAARVQAEIEAARQRAIEDLLRRFQAFIESFMRDNCTELSVETRERCDTQVAARIDAVAREPAGSPIPDDLKAAFDHAAAALRPAPGRQPGGSPSPAAVVSPAAGGPGSLSEPVAARLRQFAAALESHWDFRQTLRTAYLAIVNGAVRAGLSPILALAQQAGLGDLPGAFAATYYEEQVAVRAAWLFDNFFDRLSREPPDALLDALARGEFGSAGGDQAEVGDRVMAGLRTMDQIRHRGERPGGADDPLHRKLDEILDEGRAEERGRGR